MPDPSLFDGSPRTIAAPSPVTPERLHDGRPVLLAVPAHPWESRVVLNAAAVLVSSAAELETLFKTWDLSPEGRHRLREAGGACVMLYRAQGAVNPEKGCAPSSLGMAVFTPLLELVLRLDAPVIEPLARFHDLGVEDARCTRVGDTYYLYYTGYASLDEGAGGTTRICLATTHDFVNWELRGPLTGDINGVPNKNPALFPDPVHGKWLLLHRPMEGPDAMTIHLAEADEPEGPWRSRGKLFTSSPYQEFARSWIGAGGPPVALGEDRFLMIYHQGHFTAEGTREYDLAAALIDFRQPDPVVSRIEPLMRPTGIEREGDPDLGVDNVLFTCANYRWGQSLIVPYAGSDSRMFGAALPFAELIAALESTPAE